MAIGSDLMNWLYKVIALRLWEMKWLIPIHVIPPCHFEQVVEKITHTSSTRSTFSVLCFGLMDFDNSPRFMPQ